MKKTFVILLCLWLSASAEARTDRRLDSLMNSMSLEEKIGQLHQIDGRTDLKKVVSAIRRGQVSSIMNIVDPAVTDSLQRIAVEESPNHIPILFARDIVHGFRTILPIPLGQAASFDPQLVCAASRNTALEATECGIRWAFAPMMDLARDPRWGRVAESFGEDPFLSSAMAVAVTRGYQGDSLSHHGSMAACAKHFVGYGAAEGGRDYNTTYIPRRALYDSYFPPFKACVEEGIASFMSSFNDNDGEPSTGNKWLLTDVLRGEWGFEGIVVSDWGSVGGLIPHGSATDKRDAAKQCLEAGCDMDMMSYSYLRHLKDLIVSGELQEELLDRAVRRVLKLKLELGLFDNPYALREGQSRIYSEPVLDTACSLAEESSVLLKNDGILPLGEDIRRVLVTGPMADAAYDQMGTWALDGDKSRTMTPLKAMEEMLPASVRLTYMPVLEYPRQEEMPDVRKFRREAAKADVVLVFVGEEQMMSGEAHSLSSLHLQGRQSSLIGIAAETGTPVVVVVMAGRPLVIERELEQSSALLYMWHPGTMGGKAAVNLLWGYSSPSGRLPISFPRNEGQIPVYYNHKHTSHIAKGTEGNLANIPREKPQSVMGHTSSYLDVPPSPLFPFGYGLSYTDFELSDLSVEKPAVSASDTLEVCVTVSNIGNRKGVAVVQFYTGRSSASVTRPMRELKGFERVALEPSESRQIRCRIPVESLSFCRKDMSWGVEPGKCYVIAALDSSGGISEEFCITQHNSL